jgi:O-antigen/teichoic acid export membrane protein
MSGPLRPVSSPLDEGSTDIIDEGSADIGRKAAAGAMAVGVRGVLLRILGFAGSLVLTRLLTPSEFGALAFGLTVTAAVALLSDGGIGAGFIRGSVTPKRADLRALVGIQLVLLTTLAAASVAIASVSGRTGVVTALLMVPLPLTAFRTPAMVLLERTLNYRAIARCEVAEAVVFQTFAVGLAASGLGNIGVALAATPRTVVGTVLILRACREGRVAPSLRWSRLKGLVSFGAQFQAINLINLAGDQGINYLAAATGGLATLGLWSLAARIMQIPYMMFAALWRVSFPAMSQLVGSGDDPRSAIERSTRVVAVATGLVLAPIVGGAIAGVPALFGDRWAQAGLVLIPMCLALQVGGPCSVATTGYMFATGATRSMLRISASQTVVWLALAVPLVAWYGVLGIGLAFVPASLVDGISLARVTSRRTGAIILPTILRPLISVAVAGGVGIAIGSLALPTIVSFVGSVLTALATYVALIMVFARPMALETARVLRVGLRQSATR